MLLFFDIDGTLFDDRHRMPPSVLPALEKARQNGHYLFVNTGRTLCNMDRRLDGFPFDGWVMGCGTRILLRGGNDSKHGTQPGGFPPAAVPVPLPPASRGI